MLNARAEAESKQNELSGFEELFQEMWRLNQTLTLEAYLKVVERFADGARSSIEAQINPEKRKFLREQYRQVIEFAIDLALNRPA
jgi:hypothetical protein